MGASSNHGTARPITPGTPVAPGSAVVIAASAPGIVRLVMEDGSFLDVYAVVGTTELSGYIVKDVNAAGTTATCKVTVL